MRGKILGLALLAMISLAACENETPQAPVIVMPVFERLSLKAPPAPLPEIAIVAEDPRTMVWRPGYWSYDNEKFSWIEGKLIKRPSPTAVWAADQWIQHKYGWGYCPGHWQ